MRYIYIDGIQSSKTSGEESYSDGPINEVHLMEGGFPKNLFANTQRLDHVKELNQVNSESDE